FTAVAYAIGLLVAFDMSLGFNGITYGLLYEYVLPFRGLRIPARMGVMVGFSLAVLAGYGARFLASSALRSVRLRADLGETPGPARAGHYPRKKTVFAEPDELGVYGLIALLMLFEYVSKPLDLRQIPTAPPAVYADVL